MSRPYNAATRRSRSFSSFHQPTEARTSPRPGRSRTITPASARFATTSADASAATRQRRASRGSRARSRLAPPRRGAPGSALRARRRAGTPRRESSGSPSAARRARAGDEVGVESGCALLRHELSVVLVCLLGEVARASDAERVGLGDDECARPLGAAEPLLPRHGVVVETARVDEHRADGLCPVHEDRQAGRRAELVRPVAPHRCVHRTWESASRRVRGVTASTIRSGCGSTTTTFALDVCSGPRRPKCSSVVVITSSPSRRSSRRGRCCSRPSSTP